MVKAEHVRWWVGIRAAVECYGVIGCDAIHDSTAQQRGVPGFICSFLKIERTKGNYFWEAWRSFLNS